MKNLLVLLVLAVIPWVVYSAPKDTPLDEFDGGPRYEQQPLHDDRQESFQVCELNEHGYNPEIKLVVDSMDLEAPNLIANLNKCELV